jgi:hypothetical protein
MAYTALCGQCARADCLSTDLLHDVSPGLEAEQLEPHARQHYMADSSPTVWSSRAAKAANDGSAVRMRCLSDSLTACRG